MSELPKYFPFPPFKSPADTAELEALRVIVMMLVAQSAYREAEAGGLSPQEFINNVSAFCQEAVMESASEHGRAPPHRVLDQINSILGGIQTGESPGGAV
ncbi:MAG: hypothetical protein P4M15_13120 [Alphaproteobacteria bacterium]|nr:hypothetical protein [Alphaproteobacteria bacterium]